MSNFWFVTDGVTHVVYYAHIVRFTVDSAGWMVLHLSGGHSYNFEPTTAKSVKEALDRYLV